ncbi:MAG: glucose-6-phosphate isomerase [Opitutales bacterium]
MTWQRYTRYARFFPDLSFAIDASRMRFDDQTIEAMEEPIHQAFKAMEALEGGAIANPDEQRMVGHYWLRNPDLAPEAKLSQAIEDTVDRIAGFAAAIHGNKITGAHGPFKHLLLIGIGGSALGPQFVSDALGQPGGDKLSLHFFDNTDPDGLQRTLAELDGQLGRTLCVVVSKSGSTPETRNGMLEAQAAYRKVDLDFGRHAVAITGEGSKLDQVADAGDWLERFPMWDWVGGRTSETGPVGLVPAALQGVDIRALLAGARKMDDLTRTRSILDNPAALLAVMWFHATRGKGERDMVVLPYKDRLMLFSKYLQQLVMESLGKEKDLNGKVVNQGIAVYGNKGSTDQHAYVQQLREGINNFFVTFIEVLEDGVSDPFEVEDGITSGDYLHGFYLGTRDALSEKNRESLTLTIRSVTPESVGMLIALFERAVGLYASLIHINAYHQPGVEAGKKAAAAILELQARIQQTLADQADRSFTAEALADELGLKPAEAERVFKILDRLAANPHKAVQCLDGDGPATWTYQARSS